MIASILAKFINTVRPGSVASNAVKLKLNSQHRDEAGLGQHQQNAHTCDSSGRIKAGVAADCGSNSCLIMADCCFVFFFCFFFRIHQKLSEV